MRISKFLMIFSVAMPMAAFAQTGMPLVATPTTVVQPVAQPVAQPMAPATPEVSVLRAGTSVPLKLLEELTTKEKKLRVGQRFQLEVSENVMLGSNVIIPVGSPAVGEITDVRNKGMWGKSGKINARALYVRVGGRQIRLTGQMDDKGKAGGVAAAAVSGIVFLPAGFFMTGTSAKIPIGAPLVAFLDEDVQVAVAQAPVLVVPQTAPPLPVVPAAVAAPSN
jgi:hypothetical protein